MGWNLSLPALWSGTKYAGEESYSEFAEQRLNSRLRRAAGDPGAGVHLSGLALTVRPGDNAGVNAIETAHSTEQS